MKPRDLARCIREEVVDRNIETYERLLLTPIDQVRDATWRAIVGAFSSMSNEQQGAVRLLLRQAVVDTCSNVLGILDGTTILDSYREEFAVTYGALSERLNGDLQDYFLAMVGEESANPNR